MEQQHRPDSESEAPLLAASKPDGAASSSPRRNRFPFFCAVLASMTSVLTGYNVAVMSGAQIFMAEDLGVSDTQIELLSGAISIFSLVGALLAGWTSDRLGRRLTIVLTNGFFLVGSLIMTLAGGYTALMAGRFVAGIGVGYALVIAPVYAAEIAPASSRGLLSSLPEIFINTGVMLSYVSNFAFSALPAHLSWRLMFAVGVVPTVFLAAGVLTMPESPRWLAMKGRLDEAKAVLDRTSDTLAEAEQRLLEIEEVVVAGASNGAGGTWNEVTTKAGVRRVLATVLALQFFQQASGIDSVVLYGPRVLAMAGVTSNNLLLGLNVLFGVAKAGSILIAMALADRVGRRPLLLVSTGGMTASLLVLGSVFAAFAGAKDDAAVAAVAVAAVVAFVCTFSVGLGPLAWVYSSEILPLRLRGQGAGLGTAMNRVMSGIVTMTFISLYGAITMAGTFYLYAAVAAASFAFIYTFLPETRGRNLEDMEQLFRTNCRYR
ncbi:polyol transporter 5-like isoform X2 [Hordeum vulgare subsp. vulgare]|uniref:polyol transporter 5-like isoform X2 n=1 Tax=Hordeum vulgare subsp. vulgare TaxID=112509 RepID=UPI001D1A3860|nr:polyol transporter 5-like isoform X2 [Hordeum vulgare subsp. vulgare]